ncbi:MAG: hypothetical protein ACRDO9_00760 [Gaiellales bacterium]
MTSTVAYAILGAIVAGVVVLIGVDRTDLVLDTYLLYAGALVALAAARISRRAFPSPRGTVPALLSPRPAQYVHPESLSTTADDVALAQVGEFDVHFRLRPLLRDIAAAGLAMESGIDLDRQTERARETLSPETWELVRPDRPRPERTGESGISSASLSAVVTELETLLPP